MLRVIGHVIFLGALMVNTGCYVQPLDERSAAEEKEREAEQERLKLVGSLGECKMTRDTGCFAGEVPPAPHIIVDGLEFDDVDTLAARFFKELVQPTLKNDKEVQTTFAWVTSLRNDNFGQGVQVFVKGGAARFQNVLVNYQFHLNELPEERYEIRVQKPLKFQLKTTKIVQQVEPKPTDSPEPSVVPSPAATKVAAKPAENDAVTTTKCARLVADGAFEIRKKERTRLMFNEYQLLISDDCTGREQKQQ